MEIDGLLNNWKGGFTCQELGRKPDACTDCFLGGGGGCYFAEHFCWENTVVGHSARWMPSASTASALIPNATSATGLFSGRLFLKGLKSQKWQISVFQDTLLVSLSQSPEHQWNRVNQLQVTDILPTHVSNCICELTRCPLPTRETSFCMALLNFCLNFFCSCLFLLLLPLNISLLPDRFLLCLFFR